MRDGGQLVGGNPPFAHGKIDHMASLHQARKLNYKIVRIIRGNITHQTCHVDIALGGGAVVDHPRVVGARDHDEAGAVRKVVMVRTHAVLKAVASRTARAHHGIAAERVGKSELGTRIQVVAAVHARSQRSRSASNTLAANHVAHGRVGVGDITLDVVEQGIESLISRQARRNAHHKLGVDDRQHREQARVAQAQFLVVLLTGDHAACVGLRTGAGRGGHAHQRQRIVGDGQSKRGAAVHKVPNVTRTLVALGICVRVCRHRADALAAVHDRAAAERQHKVAAMGARHPATCVDGFAQRIGLNAVEQLVCHAGAIELGLHALQISKALDRIATSRDDKCLGTGKLLCAQLAQLARTKQHLGRREECIAVHATISSRIYASCCRHYSDRCERSLPPQGVASTAIIDVFPDKTYQNKPVPIW